MPFDANGVPFSAETKLKLLEFGLLVKWHVGMCSGIMRRFGVQEPYLYLDSNAGAGRVNGGDGSLLIAVRTLSESRLQWLARACDIEPKILLAPEYISAAGVDTGRVEVRQGDNRLLVPHWTRSLSYIYGLLFHDPQDLIDFDLLEMTFAHRGTQRLDVLIYASGTSWKRYRTSQRVSSLRERLETVGKDYWLVRKPTGRFQWSFLLGTNWRGFPEYERRGFYRIDSERGAAILSQLSETKAERFEATHTRLFELPTDLPRVPSRPSVSESASPGDGSGTKAM